MPLPTRKYINLLIKNTPSYQIAKLYGKGIRFGLYDSNDNNQVKFESEVSTDPVNFTCIAFSDLGSPLLYKKFNAISANNPSLSIYYEELIPMENRNKIKLENAQQS